MTSTSCFDLQSVSQQKSNQISVLQLNIMNINMAECKWSSGNWTWLLIIIFSWICFLAVWLNWLHCFKKEITAAVCALHGKLLAEQQAYAEFDHPRRIIPSYFRARRKTHWYIIKLLSSFSNGSTSSFCFLIAQVLCCLGTFIFVGPEPTGSDQIWPQVLKQLSQKWWHAELPSVTSEYMIHAFEKDPATFTQRYSVWVWATLHWFLQVVTPSVWHTHTRSFHGRSTLFAFCFCSQKTKVAMTVGIYECIESSAKLKSFFEKQTVFLAISNITA